MKSYAFAISAIFLLSFIIFYNQKVEIIYFFNKGCFISNMTDVIMNEIEMDMGKSVHVIYADGFSPRSEFESMLVQKYNINSVPVIIIDGKIFSGEFTYESLKTDICKRFVIKPKGCLK
ncbi:MAG: DsbA family protein [Candidatus Aenigmarchaeota archaeon]|nr:DsbA family protein [Candidatus Aenigmarchaeota archaeon]